MKTLFFDFDGTIADTKSIYYDELIKTIKIFGYHRGELDKAIDFGLSLRKTLRKIGLGFVSSYIIKNKVMKNIKRKIHKVKKCKDVDSIKKLRCKKILITNSLREFAVPILKNLGLKRYFDEIYGAEDFDDKAEFIRKCIKSKNLNNKECYYIGDRAADAKVARTAGCKSIIVKGTCAWNSPKEILKAEPDFILSDIKDIREILK